MSGDVERLRALVTNQLLDYGEARKSTIKKNLILPDILPEDFDQTRTTHRRPLYPAASRLTMNCSSPIALFTRSQHVPARKQLVDLESGGALVGPPAGA